MDDAALESLAKETIVERLRGAPDAAAAAGEVAREIVARALKSGGGDRARGGAAAACKGLMSGVLLMEKDLAAAAVAVLKQMGTVANDANQDPAELMTWAMDGIAAVAKVAGEASRSAVQDAIEAAFMGAGEVFAKACETAGA